MLLNHIIFCSLISLYSISYGQDLFVISSSNTLYKLNQSDSLTFVKQIGSSSSFSFTDIAIGDSGKFYGINNHRELHQIDTNTGSMILLKKFLNPSSYFTSLVADDNDNLYFIDNPTNKLYKYNVSSSHLDSVYNSSFSTPGDMTFYKGKIIFQSMNDRILAYDITSNKISSILCPVGKGIWGISSIVYNCDSIKLYATDMYSDMYEIKLDSNLLRKTNFKTNILRYGIYGMASTTERYALECRGNIDTVYCPPTGGGSGGGHTGFFENESENFLHIFPNPIYRGQNFSFKANSTIQNIRMISITGKELKISFTENSINLPSQISKGIYFVSFYSDNKVVTKKVIVQ